MGLLASTETVVAEPSHDLLVSTHVGRHNVSVWTDERNHLLHVPSSKRFEFPR
jgi:hypothetical protein